MVTSNFKKLTRRLKKVIANKFVKSDDYYLNLIIKNSIKNHNKSPKSIRILFAPGFNINKSFTNHDVIMASLLHSKGTTIHYLSGCGRLTNALFYGGVWTTGSIESDLKSLRTGEECAMALFSKFAEILQMSDFISNEEVKKIKDYVSKLNVSQMLSYSYIDIELGHYAMNRVRNLNMVSDIRLINNHKKYLQNNLVNCIVYAKYFEKVSELITPNRIFSHDSFYYPWAIMQKLAEKHNINFYNYYISPVRRDQYIYSNKRTAMLLDMEDVWNDLKNIIYQRKKPR